MRIGNYFDKDQLLWQSIVDQPTNAGLFSGLVV